MWSLDQNKPAAKPSPSETKTSVGPYFSTHAEPPVNAEGEQFTLSLDHAWMEAEGYAFSKHHHAIVRCTLGRCVWHEQQGGWNFEYLRHGRVEGYISPVAWYAMRHLWNMNLLVSDNELDAGAEDVPPATELDTLGLWRADYVANATHQQVQALRLLNARLASLWEHIEAQLCGN